MGDFYVLGIVHGCVSLFHDRATDGKIVNRERKRGRGDKEIG